MHIRESDSGKICWCCDTTISSLNVTWTSLSRCVTSYKESVIYWSSSIRSNQFNYKNCIGGNCRWNSYRCCKCSKRLIRNLNHSRCSYQCTGTTRERTGAGIYINSYWLCSTCTISISQLNTKLYRVNRQWTR